MIRKENVPPNHTYLLDDTTGYQDRDQSSDSDTVSVFSFKTTKSFESPPLSSPVKGRRGWDGGSNFTPAVKTNPIESLSIEARTSIQIQQLINYEETASSSVASVMNPRRTNPSSQSSLVCRTLNCGPPQLTRQCDRTQNFVENLVDTSTQMIEVIWPLSAPHCDKDYLGGKNLMSLRTFIQEVLKRSKTSYYTLQVALYYLILVKPYIPKVDRARENELSHSQRAMQCGRRMFLSALILASKYLQDRNYSARAWSKISGLKISEINSNEMTFVIAVNWKLHIPEAQFQRWANIVFRYSTSQTSPAPLFDGDYCRAGLTWKQIIPILTPELYEIDIERFSKLSLRNAPTFTGPGATANGSTFPVEGDATPKLTPARPNIFKCPPIQPKLSDMSIHTILSDLKKRSDSASNAWIAGRAMKEFFQDHQCEVLKTASHETWPGTSSIPPRNDPFSKVISGGSIISSPESMISDVSTNSSTSSRTSRSSSICSVTSAAVGYGTNPILSHRSTLASLNSSNYVPACIGRYEPSTVPSQHFHDDAEMDATLALLRLARPDKWSHKKSARHKRTRPLSIVDSDIPEELGSVLSQRYHANECVTSDSRKADAYPSILSRRDSLKNLANSTSLSRSTSSQAGSRKKPKGLVPEASWIPTSPLVFAVPSVGF